MGQGHDTCYPVETTERTKTACLSEGEAAKYLGISSVKFMAYFHCGRIQPDCFCGKWKPLKFTYAALDIADVSSPINEAEKMAWLKNAACFPPTELIFEMMGRPQPTTLKSKPKPKPKPETESPDIAWLKVETKPNLKPRLKPRPKQSIPMGEWEKLQD